MALNFIKEAITIGADKITDKTFTFFKQGFRLNGAIGEPEYRDVTVSGVDVLTLSNAEADGLNYCKLYGKCEQRNLPEGYTEVEYLQSSGTQWINTGYKPNSNIKFEISGTQSNTDSALFGISELFFCFDNGNATFYNFFGGSVGSFSATLKNVPIVLTMSASDGIVINGTKYKSLTAGSATANYPMVLFGRRNNSTGAIDKLGYHIIKYAKIYESNILIHNYIPCRRYDSVLGMYDTVTGNFLTNAGTGTFIAGADVTTPTPTPDIPIDIVSNNGVVKVSPNLFNKNKIVAGYAINVSGNIIGNSDFGYTDLIPVEQAEYIINNLTKGSILWTLRIHGYSGNGTWVAEIKEVNISDYITRVNFSVSNTNIKYVRLSLGVVNRQDLDILQLYPTQSPIGSIYTDGTTETVEITGKNLFDVDNYIEATIDPNGTITQNDDNNLYIMNVSPNNSYIFSYTPITAMSGNCLYGYTKELPTIGCTSTYNIITIEAIRNRVFTVPDGYHYLVIRLNKTSFVPKMINIQLEHGTTATDYEPYYYGGQATAENLLSVGTYKDVQEVLSGDVTKSVKILVLDGTEAWALYTGTRFYMLIKDMETFEVRKGPLLCSHYYVVSDGRPIGEVPDNSIYTANNPDKIFVQTSAYDNVNDFKAFLASQYNAGTPVIVVYPLATPTTSTVTAQTLTTKEGTNTIEITQASLTGLPIEVNYKAGVTVTIAQIENANLDNQVTVTIGE